MHSIALKSSLNVLGCVLVEYKNLQFFLSSSKILLFKNKMEALSRIEQSGVNPEGFGMTGAGSSLFMSSSVVSNLAFENSS